MIRDWKFNPADYNAEGFPLVPPGQYRVRIEKAEEKVSSTGKDMIVLTLKVSGYNGNVWHNMVFDSSSAQSIARTNDNLGRIYDSFGIPAGNLNLPDWEGEVGGAQIKNDSYNGKMRASVAYFLRRKEQDELPMWQEKPVGNINPEMVNPDDDPIPF